MLPLGPMGVGHSPYQTFSAFAASALWISPEALRKEGWLNGRRILTGIRLFPNGGRITPGCRARSIVCSASPFGRFLEGKLPKAFRDFEEEHQDWLDDYALYTALQRLQGKASWTQWPEMLRRRERVVLQQIRHQLADQIAFQKFVQFIFFRQWKALKTYARENGVGLIGDLPFFVSLDSADVWAHRGLFELDARGMPRGVGGVPPDAFSKTGQRWGNPLYDWDAHKREGYTWWIQRFKQLFQLFDVVRLDHFIGFHRYWEIPPDDKTALNGHYRAWSGADFFNAIQKALPGAAFHCRRSGESGWEESPRLRKQFQIPGMSVLQFAFSGDPAKNPYLPDKLTRDTVVYTGTHDNNTTKGWFTSDATEAEIKRVRKVTRRPTGPAHWQLIRLAYESAAGTAIIPMQDLLGLGPEARMNYPGRTEGNWVWRLAPDISLEPIASNCVIRPNAPAAWPFSELTVAR